MEEKFSRVEKNEKIYSSNDDHKIFDILFHIFFTLLVLISALYWSNVFASSDYHNVVTNAIYTGTTHCNSNQVGICASDTSSTSYSRYTFGTTSYQNTLSMNFWLNTTVRKNVNATIRLTGSNWANVPYTCQTNYFTDCRVVRANSTILNINFSNPDNAVSGVEFFITANGSILNTNDTFYVQKADLYETNFIDEESQNTQDLINNQNQNTEDIINNNNQNTQDIILKVQDLISNNEELTQNIINGMSCPVGPLPLTIQEYSYINNKYLNSSGENVSQSGYSISSYVELKPNTQYKIQLLDTLNTPSLCFYRGKSQSQLISCIQYARQNNLTFTTPNIAGVVYTMFSLGSRGVSINGPVCNDWQREAQQKLNEIQNETNDLIKDDSVDQNQANDFFSNFSTQDNGGISSLITKPLRIINNLLSNNSSCSNLTLPVFMGVTDAYLPSGCILWNNAPNNVVTLWNTLVIGFGSYFVLKSLFKDIENLKDPGNDKVEVMDL